MRLYRRRRSTNYLFPFLLLLCVGVLIVLAFQVGSGLFSPVKGDAVIHLAEGRAKVLPFGKAEWENTYSGVKVRLGDSVKTLKNSIGVISFYDGTLLRLDEDTQITLIDITKHGEDQEILLALNYGQVWVNKPNKKSLIKKTDFVIQTAYAAYSITGTVFNLQKDEIQEVLKVIRGSVTIDILEEKDGKTRFIESIPVGVGQKSIIDSAVMKAFTERQSPSVLSAVESEFMDTKWYVFNAAEDSAPTDFASGQKSNALDIVVDATAEIGETLTGEEGNEPDLVNNKVEEEIKPVSDFDAPIITNPTKSFLTTENGKLSISGSVDTKTESVKVKQLLPGMTKEEVITLSKYVAGTTAFKYNLSPDFDNIRSGKNTYKVVAANKEGEETVSISITIEYRPANAVSNDSASAVDENAVTSSEAVSIKVNTVAQKTYSEGMTVTAAPVTVSGSAVSADKVFVNEYQLSRFVSGSKSWSYNLSESFGNLKVGKNELEVYALDSNGKKSSIQTVIFNYEKPVTEISDTTSTNTAQ